MLKLVQQKHHYAAFAMQLQLIVTMGCSIRDETDVQMLKDNSGI